MTSSRTAWWILMALVLVALAQGARAEGLPEEGGVLLVQGGPADKVREVNDRYDPKLQQLKIQIQSARLQLAQFLTAPNPDKAKVKAAMDRTLDLEREHQHVLLDKAFATLEVLQPEERSRYINSIVDKLTQ